MDSYHCMQINTILNRCWFCLTFTDEFLSMICSSSLKSSIGSFLFLLYLLIQFKERGVVVFQVGAERGRLEKLSLPASNLLSQHSS